MFSTCLSVPYSPRALPNVYEALEALISSLYNNGQILGYDSEIFEDKDTLNVNLWLPLEDSLAKKNDNTFVKKNKAALTGLKATITESKSMKIYPDATHLKKAQIRKNDFLILYTKTYINSSVLRGSHNFDPIPLYLIAKTHDSTDYYDVIQWAKCYQAYYRIWEIASAEKYSLNQLSGFDSALTKQGTEICHKIESSTQKPVFYYLFRYIHKTTLQKEKTRKCPGCAGDWLMDTPLFDVFDFKCDKCRMLSNISLTVRYLK